MKIILSIIEKNKIIEYFNDRANAITSLGVLQRKKFLRKVRNYAWNNERLFYMLNPETYLQVVADDDQEAQTVIFNSMHLPDHTGMKAMYINSKMRYVGFKRERIDSYVSNCIICNRHIPLRRFVPIIPIISLHPWQLVQMDCIDMRNYADVNDGYGWILNILDCYSKFLFPVAMKNKTAENVRNALRQCVYREGCPIVIQTDNGREFNNGLLIEYLRDLNIEFRRGRPRHPQNQGQVERANQTLTRKIAKCLSNSSNKRWIDVIDEITFKYNTTWHRAINMTPMQAFRVRNGINLPAVNEQQVVDENEEQEDENEVFIGNLEHQENSSDELVEAIPIENTQTSIIAVTETVNQVYRERYVTRMQQDADVHYHSIQFNPGDYVLLQRSFDNNSITRRRKMDSFYEEGRWIIVERVGSDSFKIQKHEDATNSLIVCKNRLKKINSL
jgi:hypothetical protein